MLDCNSFQMMRYLRSWCDQVKLVSSSVALYTSLCQLIVHVRYFFCRHKRSQWNLAPRSFSSPPKSLCPCSPLGFAMGTWINGPKLSKKFRTGTVSMYNSWKY
jgi:hypothetical protein